MTHLAEAGLLHDAHWRASVGRAEALESLGRRPAALSALTEAERQLEAASRMVAITGGRDSFVAQREEGIRLFVDLLLRDGQPRAAFDAARRSRSRLLRDFIREERLARLSPAEQEHWDTLIEELVASSRLGFLGHSPPAVQDQHRRILSVRRSSIRRGSADVSRKTRPYPRICRRFRRNLA